MKDCVSQIPKSLLAIGGGMTAMVGASWLGFPHSVLPYVAAGGLYAASEGLKEQYSSSAKPFFVLTGVAAGVAGASFVSASSTVLSTVAAAGIITSGLCIGVNKVSEIVQQLTPEPRTVINFTGWSLVLAIGGEVVFGLNEGRFHSAAQALPILAYAAKDVAGYMAAYKAYRYFVESTKTTIEPDLDQDFHDPTEYDDIKEREGLFESFRQKSFSNIIPGYGGADQKVPKLPLEEIKNMRVGTTRSGARFR